MQYSGIGYLLQGVLYCVLRIRHFCFDRGIIHSQYTPIHSVGIGNIEAGGSGKTPHSLFLLQEALSRDLLPAFISRGYGRQNSADAVIQSVNPIEYGDEPSLIWSRFQSRVQGVVAKKRVLGFPLLQTDRNFLLFDDIMQHRAVKPNVLITITRFQQPFTENALFPIGLCRDIRYALRRSDYLIVSYTPQDFQDRQAFIQTHRLNAYFPEERILFSRMQLGYPVEIFNSQKLDTAKFTRIELVSGIAKPEQFREDVEHIGIQIDQVSWYADHYQFTEQEISDYIHQLIQTNSACILTEKDAVKWKPILEQNNTQEWQNRVYVCIQEVVPIFQEDWDNCYQELFPNN